MLTAYMQGNPCVGLLTLEVNSFRTEFGWWALLGHERWVFGLTIGHASQNAAVEHVSQPHYFHDETVLAVVESDWNADLRKRLEDYAYGTRESFAGCEVWSAGRTVFQKKVVWATRQIGYGKTLTYGELAKKAGSPRAARAVGSVMSSNRVPIIVPCHRVVGAGNKLGGFSAPQGIGLKEQLLELESGED